MSVYCRKQKKTPQDPSPIPMLNYTSQQDEYGKVKLSVSEPVAFSIAEDFSIVENASNGKASSPRYRISSDPVDVETKLSKLL